MIKVKRGEINFVREPLKAPFGFKGRSVSELWQSVVLLESDSGRKGVGLGVQSPLWSDSGVFAQYGELSSNSLMLLMTDYAMRIVMETDFETPMDLLDRLLPEVYEYGKNLAASENLRQTYALNALVAVDNAAWQLYTREKGIKSFDEMIPDKYRPPMHLRQRKLAGIPLITYGVSIDEIIRYVKEGSFFLKIKIGNDPDKDGDHKKMLEWDKKRLNEIHEAVKHIETPYVEGGCIPYYLDANGRYDSKERLMELVNFAEKIGALDRIILLEEPFSEEYKEDVSDIPVRIAADESAHSDADAMERIQMGYKAMALKPIAKTLSMTLKILKIAYDNNIPCFCADLTVNPVMVDWNKNVAARIEVLPGMKVGILESNGHQNYVNWEKMKGYHPCHAASWIETRSGMFDLDRSFFQESGGILKDSSYYMSLVK